MNRQEFAKRIKWEFIIWVVGIINVTAMLPQLIRLIATRETAGLSLGMFIIYFMVQVGFSIEGFFKRNAMLMWCLGLSAVINASIIIMLICLRT